MLSLSPELHRDLPSALLYLDLLRLNNDLAEEKRHLATDFDSEISDNEGLLEREARALRSPQRLPQSGK